MAKSNRGAVGKAAETLKAALVARLQSSSQPLDEGLRAAVAAVDAFLSRRCESEADLQRLKGDIKRLMLQAAQPGKAPDPPTAPVDAERRQPHVRPPSVAPASSSPLSPTVSGRLNQSQPLPSRSGLGSREAGKQTSFARSQQVQSREGAAFSPTPSTFEGPSTSGRGILDIGRRRPRLSQSAHLPDIRGDMFGVKPYTQRTSIYVGATGATDWTMPRSIINRFAHLDFGDYAKMTLVQDDLARTDDERRRHERRSHDQQHAAQLRDQMAHHAVVAEQEAQAKRKEQEAVAASVRQFEAEEQLRLQQEHERNQATRAMYDGQVQEARERRRQAEEALARTKILERKEQQQLALEEQALKAQALADNREYRSRYTAELREALAVREAHLAEQQRLELKMQEEAIRVMGEQELRRQAAVQLYKDKVARLAAKAGSEQLQASHNELAAAAAARAARLAAEHEAAIVERLRKDKLRRDTEARERRDTLDKQVAAHAAAREAAVAAGLEAKRLMELQNQAAQEREREAKAAKKARMAADLVEQKAAVLVERQRRFVELVEPGMAESPAYHRLQMEGTAPSLSNVAVAGRTTALLGAAS